jgi:uncharacterized protein
LRENRVAIDAGVICDADATLAARRLSSASPPPAERPAAASRRGRPWPAHTLVGVPAPGEPDPRSAGIPGARADPSLIDFATKIFNLARAGDTAAIAAYVDAGVPVNLTNDKGDTLLMLAAYHGHADTVTALLQRGADPGRPNDRGQTPLAGAAFKKEPQIVRALLEAGADPAAGQPSAADTAAMFGNEEFLAWFAGRGDRG